MSVQQKRSLTTAAILHELEGRASSVLMFAQAARLDAAQHDLRWLADRVVRIERAAQEMQCIIGAIRVLEDESAPERASIDLSALTRRILKAHIKDVEAVARTEVRVQSNIHVHAQPHEVEILLRNLLINALKFSALREKPEIRIIASDHFGRTAVHVSDNGIGIAPEDAKRMFELFARCHPQFPGSGVGLAIAHRIVQRHGGRIWAAGQLGVGTTVSFFV